MAKQSGMLQLGKLIAKDLARGASSPRVRDLGEALVSDPDSMPEVVELLFAESRKKRPNQALIAAFSFMLERTLESARWREENESVWANDLIASVRSSVLKAAQREEGSSTVLLVIAQCFAAAKVDFGDELRGMVERAARPAPDIIVPEVALAELETAFGKLAKELDHDPFLIHAQASEMLDSLPVDHRIQMIAALASLNAPALRAAVAGWLLDSNSSISNAVAAFLAQAAARGLVSGATVNRLVVMRNWVGEDRRSAIDAVIRAARQKAAEPAAAPSSIQVGAVVVSSCDGAGAQSFFVVVRQKRKHSIASLLIKHGFGIRDAWVRAGLTGAEIEMLVDQIDFELGGFESSLDVVQTSLAHGLATSIKTGQSVPFGLLQFIEATGLSAVVPSHLNPEELLDQLFADIPAEKKKDAGVGRALAGSRRWQADHAWLRACWDSS